MNETDARIELVHKLLTLWKSLDHDETLDETLDETVSGLIDVVHKIIVALDQATSLLFKINKAQLETTAIINRLVDEKCIDFD